MAQFGEALAALRAYRNELTHLAQADVAQQFRAESGTATAFAAAGGVAAFTTPLLNVHATGVGVRVRKGRVVPEEFVIKVYVFQKLPLAELTPEITKRFQNVEVDVEPLPVQLALDARRSRRGGAKRPARVAIPAATPANRSRRRPIAGGLSIAPLNEDFVGTLGCFVRRVAGGTEQIFALSNNHVLADTNRLPIGTPMVQPGPEVEPPQSGDVFAALSAFVPIAFPASRSNPVTNRFDAAIALTTATDLIETGRMFGIAKYVPQLAAPVPGMRVIKSGRTTGVTRGVIAATNVNSVQVNYGTRTSPRIATFNDTVQIVTEDGTAFSAPGDSGSIILEEATGKPVALLFAGDGRSTTACDLGGVCREFQALPL